MRMRAILPAVVVMVLVSTTLQAQAPKVQPNPRNPIMNFVITDPVNGIIKDTTGNAHIVVGKNAKVIRGPAGARALSSDGTEWGRSRLDMSKISSKFDGFEYTVSMWARIEERVPGAIGFGIAERWEKIMVQIGAVSRGKEVQYYPNSPTKPGEWYHVVFAYSKPRGDYRLYLNGVLQSSATGNKDLPILIMDNIYSIGSVKSAIATIRVWDRFVDSPELLSATIDANHLKDMRGRMEKIDVSTAGLRAMKRDCQQRLDRLTAAAKNPIQLSQIDELQRLIDAALRLSDASKGMGKTVFKDSPFAIMQVQPCSPIIRHSDAFPTDAEFTSNFRVAAAKGEFEPISFVVHAYEKVDKFELIPSDFVHEDGSTKIPASAMDRKMVKVWYQSDWNMYFRTGQNLVPDLLLNDEKLVKVDELKRKNYLRLSYPEGEKYGDVNFRGTSADTQSFRFCVEPVLDADSLLPVELEPRRNKQFWFTIQVPEKAKPGLYKASVMTRCDGKDTGAFTITLRVYPFSLPIAKTRYNLDLEYITYVIGGANLPGYVAQTKDIKEAERILRLDIINQKNHNIRHQGIPQFSLNEDQNELAIRDIKMRLAEGLNLKPMITVGAADNTPAYHGFAFSGFEKSYTPEVAENLLEEFKKVVDRQMEVAEKLVGHKDFYFYGIDEAQGAGAFRYMANFRDYIYSKGGKVFTSGWGNNYEMNAAFEDMHAEAATIDKKIADRWHALGGRLVSYAAPFAGPDNPDLMRRSHGLRMYCADYDGFFMLSYFEGIHVWNECVSDYKYRNFLVAYPTIKGPINSIAFEGLREGIDDIRYATLLRQLAQECMKSDNRTAKYTGRRALAWFELQDITPVSVNLDAIRLEMADHIVAMMNALGKKEI